MLFQCMFLSFRSFSINDQMSFHADIKKKNGDAIILKNKFIQKTGKNEYFAQKKKKRK